MVMGMELDTHNAASSDEMKLSYVKYPELPPGMFHVPEQKYDIITAL